jgi:catechol 2,3-dioxygenase-like lactoylglutathione lyase family enzyme
VIRGLRHTGIVVPDLEQALAFYEGLLGFSVARRMEEGGAWLSTVLGIADIRATTIKMNVPGGGMVELLYFPDHPQGPRDLSLVSGGPTHIALTVADLDNLHQVMQQEGIHFVAAPNVSPDGKVKMAFCQAPDGTFVELVEERSLT